jgi:hypothetical protein
VNRFEATMSRSPAPVVRPWYRQLWPWLLMLPPAAAVVGGFLTLYLALATPDPLVRRDCERPEAGGCTDAPATGPGRAD